MTLPSAYLGNIEYFYYLATNKTISIDHAEPYQKQTYRNRATILSANGIQNLSVPVERPFGKATKISEVLINKSENWQKNHIKSIESAYRRTPFYEYYSDAIFDILNRDYAQLIDLNKDLTLHLAEKLGIVCELIFLTEPSPLIPNDKRQILSPKTASNFETYRYIQTFEEKFGFQNNLSIIDLLFNEGPNAICIIEESGFNK